MLQAKDKLVKVIGCVIHLRCVYVSADLIIGSFQILILDAIAKRTSPTMIRLSTTPIKIKKG